MKRRPPAAAPRADYLRALPWLALASAIAIVASGFGTRFGLWNLAVGFGMLRYATYAALAIALVALVALAVRASRRARLRLVLALVVALAASAVPLYLVWQARARPPINDISTDLANPPQFLAIAPLRAKSTVPLAYPGPEAARAQRASYPDVRTRVVMKPTEEMFEKALGLARDAGWTIVASDARTGRIEATATTPWFGFKDDVVIRITRAGTGSRIDMRSVSRVGKSDLGVNADRVRKFMARIAS